MPLGRPKGARTKSKKGAPTSRKIGDGERQVLKVRCAELDVQGYNANQIAPLIGVSEGTTRTLLAEIRQEYEASYLDSRKALVMRETSVLLDVRRRAYEAMELVKKTGKVRKVRKNITIQGDDGLTALPAEEVTQTVESVDIGGYLRTILDTEDQLASLWGLKELPKVVFNLGPTVQTNVFQSVLQAVLGTPQPVLGEEDRGNQGATVKFGEQVNNLPELLKIGEQGDGQADDEGTHRTNSGGSGPARKSGDAPGSGPDGPPIPE